VINCAAYTAVDKAETEEVLATRINGEAVGLLGELARKHGIHLITISTDYVFYGSGETPWPADAPSEAYGPLNAYGRGKLDGERRLRAAGGHWTIARTQWLYGDGGPNFIKSIARLATDRDEIKVVNDQFGAVTWTHDVADGLYKLAAHGAQGCFHLVNDGFGSWFEAACQIVEKLGLDCIVQPCLTSEFPRPAARPANSRMSQSKFIQLTGSPLPKWQHALDRYLEISADLAEFRQSTAP
jgi:dTDP-4-dehydrorhamnose reductase